jgi:Prealbumin-like fold domain
MDSSKLRRRVGRPALVAIGVAVLLVSSVIQAFGSHGLVNLTGSNFEIDTDANLKVDHAAPSIDWASVNETRQEDQPTGQQDDSFGEGTKEDTAVPTVVDGSIPNNKSDLLNFGVYLEDNAAGKFLNVFWQRVQEPSGTTNMDFEFNKSKTLSANGVTPVRSAGDILIQYDLTSGGTHPELFLSTWVTTGSNSLCEANGAKVPCWGDRVNLTTAGLGTGSINTSPIPGSESDGLGDISPRTFGEAQIDFDAFGTGGDPCAGFGSAYLKSRSSDSFTAALKDFIAPTPVDFNECGAIKITKTRKHAADGPGSHPHAGVTFTITGGNLPAGGTTVVTDADGVACLDNLVQSTTPYSVAETVPTGYAADGPTTQTVTVDTDATCTDDPYVGESVSFSNTPLTDLSITVNSQVDGGTASTVSCTPDGPSGSTDANGDGTFSDTNLLPGTYTCTVVIDP